MHWSRRRIARDEESVHVRSVLVDRLVVRLSRDPHYARRAECRDVEFAGPRQCRFAPVQHDVAHAHAAIDDIENRLPPGGHLVSESVAARENKIEIPHLRLHSYRRSAADDHARAHAARRDLRNLATVARYVRRRHLLQPPRQVDPQLHPAIDPRLSRHLGVKRAAARREQLHAAGRHAAHVAQIVAVLERSVEHVRERLESAVRVCGKARRGCHAEIVEQHERIDVIARCGRKQTHELRALAVGGCATADDTGTRVRTRSQRTCSRRAGLDAARGCNRCGCEESNRAERVAAVGRVAWPGGHRVEFHTKRRRALGQEICAGGRLVSLGDSCDVAAVGRPVTIAHMTEAEYLAYDLAHEGKCEFVNGEVLAMSGVTPAHDVVQVNLVVALANRLRGTDCRVRGPDLRVRLDETGLYGYPDLTIVRGAAGYAPTRPETLLNPRVIVEVLSESTEEYDRGAKAAHYRRRASVESILLVDSRQRLVEVQRRNANGTWTLSEHTAGTIRVLDVDLPVDEIYDAQPTS